MKDRVSAGNCLLWAIFLIGTFELLLAVGTTAAAYTPGDFNKNASVDAADYVVLRKNPGGIYTPEDYSTWRANFGDTECLAPTFELQPQSQTVGIGSDVTFFVEVTGTEPFVYQWEKDEVPILGAIYPSFSIFDVHLSDAGYYGVICANSCGSSVSDTASLKVVLEGDYNNNGVVDAADYVVWRKNEGTINPLPNDLIGGTIGTQQYDQWRSHFAQAAAVGAGSIPNAAVPEPANVLMLVMGVLATCARHRPCEP